MINYENYKPNVEVVDKYDMASDVIASSLCCTNKHLKIINRRKEGVEDTKSTRKQPLVAAVLGINNTATGVNPFVPKTPELENTWTDIDEQQLYVNTLPNCFLIISKPGAGSFPLGEAMAKKLNCVHICPRNVILDEIEQKSPTGKCIDFNLKHFNEIKANVLMPLIARKLQSPVVRHRGYVISGLPLISTTRSDVTLFKKLYCEEPVVLVDQEVNELVLTFKKKKKKKGNKKEPTESVSSLPSVMGEEGMIEEEEQEEEHIPEADEEDEEEEDKAIEFPKFILEPCEDIIVSFNNNYYELKKVDMVNQLNQLLAMGMKPDVVININCPDEDLVIMKNHKYLDFKTNFCFTDPLLSTPSNESRWPSKYSIYEDETNEVHAARHKYIVKQPFNFTEESVEQLCNYRSNLLPYIFKKINDINPKLIIKVDGRTSVKHMLHEIYERLLLLPVTKPVHIPQPLYLEDPSDDMEEFWKSMEAMSIAKSNNISFNYSASPWYNRCPLELKKRLTVRGKPKYAASLFKHIYLLSSVDALVAFCRNPREYLNIHYLEPVCRIVVMGTESSGKTMIANCLSWLFDTPVTSYSDIFDEVKKTKYDAFAATILSEIIAKIEDTRLEEWQRLEAERLTNLETWQNTNLAILKKYNIVLTEYTRQVSDDRGHGGGPVLNKLQTSIENYKKQLPFLPFLDDIEWCKSVLASKDITEYAPASLTIVAKKPNIPVLGDPDVTKAIEDYIQANNLQNEVSPNSEDVMNIVMDKIKTADAVAKEASKSYGKYIIDGFPSDSEYWTILSDSKLLPDNTIAIIENKEIDKDMIQHYRTIKMMTKLHYEQFLQANDPLIDIKLQLLKTDRTKISDNCLLIQKFVKDFVEEIMDGLFPISVEDMEHFANEEITALTQRIELFKEGWDSVKVALEEKFKSFIEVEINDVTDIEVVEEVLRKLRQSYCIPCEVNEEGGEEQQQEEENDTSKDLLTFNDSRFLCETGIYCPIAYFDYGVLWEGKPEFSAKYGDKWHYFASEECIERFRKDINKYQSYNKPFKAMPPLRICVMGCIGSGKTTISKYIAKELGLLHVDFEDFVNNFLMPRHFKKVGRKYDNSFTEPQNPEEAGVEFQLDEENENLLSDIISNETELRRMVSNYFERATPLFSVLMQKILKILWFEDPFVTTGFVIDGFPKVSNDVEDMAACFCVPDLVLELACSMEVAVERMSPIMVQRWKEQQDEAKRRDKAKLDLEKKVWMDFITKQVVAKVICDDILDNVMTEVNVPEAIGSNQSTLFNADPGAAAIDLNVLTTYKDLIEQYPAPVSSVEWQKTFEAREEIVERIEAIFESDDDGIQTLKEILQEQRIRTKLISADRPFNKVSRKVLAKLSPLRDRGAIFEQTFIISCELSDTLLSKGFCFLSKFSRLCPVYLYENPNAILNPYKVSRQNGTVFAIVHRCYVYYIHGEASVIKFRKDPLKYITSKNILSFHIYPLRLAVIGPPKSGKSSLSARLAKHFGLRCVSKGKAIRNVLENMHWTTLASKMNTTLKAGGCIDYEHIIYAVQTALFDFRTSSEGFVLDGFPDSPPEAMELDRDGLYPTIVFDLSSYKTTILQNAKNEVYLDIIKTMPPFSQTFTEFRFSKWSDQAYGIRDYIKNDCQNLVAIDGNISKWKCFRDSIEYINSIIPKIHFYIVNDKTNLVLPVDVMCITNKLFYKTCSTYENMCPVCLRKKFLGRSSVPIDRKGMIQYLGLFYWICPEHMEMVVQCPEKYLSSQRPNLPEIPAVVRSFNVATVYENGICIVTYAENLPAQIIKTGSNRFAAVYNRRTYLFCTEHCLTKFLAKPHLYYDITVFKGAKGFPQVSLRKLPNIGYLEQTLGDILTKACCAVNVVRPKYPGLDIKVSALLFIGLYLKINNPLIDESVLPCYQKAFSVYEARSKFILNLGLRLRSTDNPFAKYPKCCSNKKRTNSDTVCKPPSVSTLSQILSPFRSSQDFDD